MIFIPYCVCLVITAGKKGIGLFSAWLAVSGLGQKQKSQWRFLCQPGGLAPDISWGSAWEGMAFDW